MLLFVLVVLALSLGEASADGTEPDGEVTLDDMGLDPDDLAELADHALLDVREESSDRLATIDLDDLDEIEELDDLDLEMAGTELDLPDLASADRASGDLAGSEGGWPATGTTDARAAALARRRTLLGRVDLTLTWRRTEPIVSPRRDEVWLYGTWQL